MSQIIPHGLTNRAVFGLVLLFTVTVSTRSAAQSTPSASTATADSVKAFVGAWQGTYTSDHAPPGAMKLVIVKDSVLKMTSLAMAMGKDMTEMSTKNFTAAATDISWTQDTMGMSCEAAAILKNGQMKGTIVCGHGSVTFTLDKS